MADRQRGGRRCDRGLPDLRRSRPPRPRPRPNLVALVDGNNHQIDRIQAEARTRNVPVAIVIDFIHVLEYLWRSACSFHDEGNSAAERWVRDKPPQSWPDKPNESRPASDAKPPATGSTCQRRHLRPLPGQQVRLPRLPTAPQAGWPIATGIIAPLSSPCGPRRRRRRVRRVMGAPCSPSGNLPWRSLRPGAHHYTYTNVAVCIRAAGGRWPPRVPQSRSCSSLFPWGRAAGKET